MPDHAGPGEAREAGRILIVTDAWYPQINGVVVTLGHLKQNLEAMGVAVRMLTPSGFRTVPMPSYPAIRLALATPRRVERLIERARADHVHIATKGPLGLLARATACATALPSRPATIQGFPNICARACRCRSPGAMPGCGASTMPEPERWSRRGRSPRSFRRGVFAI